MTTDHLDFGDSLAGLLVDGVRETPFTAATLTMRAPRGIEIDVPHISHDPTGQFAHLKEWFRGRNPPGNMLLHLATGCISLFELRWHGHSTPSGDRLAVGVLSPDVAVLHRRDGPLQDPLIFKEMRSRVDGLNKWSGMSSVNVEHDTDTRNRVKKVKLEVGAARPLSWGQGDARMFVRADWRVAYPENGYSAEKIIDDNVVIESVFKQKASYGDHLGEQIKVVNLMVLLFGSPIPFREHRIRDSLFASRLMSGRVYGHPFVELISRATIADRTISIPTSNELARPLAFLSQLNRTGLETWAANYNTWRRFILPAVSVLGKNQAFIEDIVISTSMAIEAAGQLIGPRQGEAGLPPSAKNSYRCLDLLDLDWGPKVPNTKVLAQAMAANYNTVKHFDRGDFPSHGETAIISSVNRMVVRLVALTLTGKSDEILKDIRENNGLWRIKEQFDMWGLELKEGGKWAASPANP